MNEFDFAVFYPFLGLICGSGFFIILLGLISTALTKDCPKCKRARRIYINGVDYVCQTCKGMGSVNRSFKEWINGMRRWKNKSH